MSKQTKTIGLKRKVNRDDDDKAADTEVAAASASVASVGFYVPAELQLAVAAIHTANQKLVATKATAEVQHDDDSDDGDDDTSNEVEDGSDFQCHKDDFQFMSKFPTLTKIAAEFHRSLEKKDEAKAVRLMVHVAGTLTTTRSDYEFSKDDVVAMASMISQMDRTGFPVSTVELMFSAWLRVITERGDLHGKMIAAIPERLPVRDVNAGNSRVVVLPWYYVAIQLAAHMSSTRVSLLFFTERVPPSSPLLKRGETFLLEAPFLFARSSIMRGLFAGVVDTCSWYEWLCPIGRPSENDLYVSVRDVMNPTNPSRRTNKTSGAPLVVAHGRASERIASEVQCIRGILGAHLATDDLGCIVLSYVLPRGDDLKISLGIHTYPAGLLRCAGVTNGTWQAGISALAARLSPAVAAVLPPPGVAVAAPVASASAPTSC
jgi:hypothetical protein